MSPLDPADRRFELSNSIITIEDGPAGTLVRIERRARPRVEYAGPLLPGTIDALAEVAHGD